MSEQNKWAGHLLTTNPKMITELGVQLGYPKCCISEFCESQKKQAQGKPPTRRDQQRLRASYIGEQFSGFIPCQKHAKEILKKKIKLEDLVENRSDEFPEFPLFELKC